MIVTARSSELLTSGSVADLICEPQILPIPFMKALTLGSESSSSSLSLFTPLIISSSLVIGSSYSSVFGPYSSGSKLASGLTAGANGPSWAVGASGANGPNWAAGATRACATPLIGSSGTGCGLVGPTPALLSAPTGPVWSLWMLFIAS